MKSVKAVIGTTVTWLLFCAILWPSEAAEKTIISYSSRSYVFLPAEVAAVKGFFRDESLETVLIQMRSPVAVPALMNGEIQYTLTFGNILTAALQGMPFKQIAVVTEKPTHHIVSRPEIKTIADLRGKRIGTLRIGGSDQLAAEAILQAKGLQLTDVKFIALGADDPVRVEIFKKGLVDAICVSPPSPLRLQREGFNILGGPKDLKVGSPLAAISTTDSRVKNRREEAKKVVRATIRALRFIRERKEEVVPIMAHWLGQTHEVASESYDLIVSSFSSDGGTSDATYQFAIDARKKALKLEKTIPLSQVRDFTLLKEAQKELGL
ncbi:MAG: ABC transporter substrate-binding protein [Deltaproteobacteria bacterium]|nr:ABC transporter substrate-binding protein [Deltaproteobacteria bacterium]